MLSVSDSSRRSSSVASGRKPYARIPEVLPIPNLIELQLDSFKWFIDNGLRELFDEISPIQDFTEQGHGAPLQGVRVRGTQVRRARVPHARPHFQQAALRLGRAADQGDGRDPAPARVHGRLPVHDRAGHVHHQRRRARRGQPAGPLAGRLLHRVEDPATGRNCSTPRSSRTAVRGWSSRPPPAVSCMSRSIASASSRRPSCCAPSATRRTTRSARSSRASTPARRAFIAIDAREGQHQHPRRGPHRGLQEAAPGRSAHRRQRREAGREPLLQLPPL